MFNNINTDAAAAAAPLSAFATAPMTMEQLLGINIADANILTGLKTFPAGKYGMIFEGIDQGEYDIKQEEHAFVGGKGLKLTFKMKTTRAIGLKGTDNKPLTLEAMNEWIGVNFEESILFGNDGLPNKKDLTKPAYPGRDKLATMLARFAGEDNYKALVAQSGGNLLKIVEPMIGKQFACEISHNVNPNDPNKRVQHQLNIFGEFVPMTF